jgi:hypothetical protein
MKRFSGTRDAILFTSLNHRAGEIDGKETQEDSSSYPPNAAESLCVPSLRLDFYPHHIRAGRSITGHSLPGHMR